MDSGSARRLVASRLDLGGGWQPADVSQVLLGCYRIPVVITRVVEDAEAAVAAADETGYPVALKAADPSLVHKSDLGAVRLNLPDAAAVRTAFAAIAAALGRDPTPVSVQPMVAPGVEMVAGVVHDRLFGSLVMLGLGGVYTDVLGDRTFRLLPVTDLDAGRMWRSLRASRLLTGYRGSPPVDVAALEDVR